MVVGVVGECGSVGVCVGRGVIVMSLVGVNLAISGIESVYFASLTSCRMSCRVRVALVMPWNE